MLDKVKLITFFVVISFNRTTSTDTSFALRGDVSEMRDLQPVYTTASDRARLNQFDLSTSVNMTGTDVNRTVPLWLGPPNTIEPA